MIEINSCGTAYKLYTARRNIQYPVHPSSMEALDHEFCREKTCNEAIPSHKAHVTFVDLKSPLLINSVLKRLGINKKGGEVLDRYLEFEDGLRELPDSGLLTYSEGWAIFADNRYLVAQIPKDPEWMELRRGITDKFEHFLASLGIKDLPSFLKTNPATRNLNEEDFDPHVTLGKGLKSGAMNRLRRFDIRGWEILLMPPVLKGSILRG